MTVTIKRRSFRGPVFLVAVLLLGAGGLRADLCAACRELLFTADVGECTECGGWTASAAHKLCRRCSVDRAECVHCRAPLPGTPKPVPLEAGTERLLILGLDAGGKRVTLPPRQILLVRLPGNPTTGFNWERKELRGESLRQRGKTVFRPPRGGRQPLVGAAGVFEARFAAAQPGESTIVFVYRRPWEKKAPNQTFRVTVVVPAREAP